MVFDILIKNGVVLSGESAPFIGSVAISGGKILEIFKNPDPGFQAKETIDATGKIAMPGLINAHCHGDMTLGRGLLDDLTLLEQNEKMRATNWLYTLIGDEDRYYSRQLTYLEAIKSGTTFLMENMYWSLGLKSVEAMAKTGIKGALSEDIRPDFRDPGRMHGDGYLEEFIKKCQENSLIPVFGTVSEEDFEPGLLKQVTDKVKRHGVYSTQHLAETPWRRALVYEKYGMRPVEYLCSIGALHEKMIGSHAVYVDGDEIHMLAQSGVGVVNTPLCEMKIADGIAPIPGYLKAGVTAALGTDGAMWNNSNDLFREMKGVCLLHTVNSGIRSLTARDAFKMATAGGARLFGLSGETGTLAGGKSADLILLDGAGPKYCPLRIDRHENVLSSVVFNAVGEDVTHSIIGGKLVMRDRKILTVDEESIKNRVQEIGERIARELPDDAFLG